MKFVGRLGLVMASLLPAGCGGDAGDASSKSSAESDMAAMPHERGSPAGHPAGRSTMPAGAEAGAAAEVPASAEAAASPPPPPAAFMQCRSCHDVEQGKNGIGPSLHGIVGRPAGSLAGFAYSPALKSSGIVWDGKSLDTWIASPMKMVPGTRMVIGVPNAEARKSIIDYLERLR